MYTQEDTHVQGKLWIGPTVNVRDEIGENEAWIEVSEGLQDESLHSQIEEIHKRMKDPEIHRVVIRSKYGKSKAPMLAVAYACKYLGRNFEECIENVCQSRVTDISLLDFFIIEGYVEGLTFKSE